MITTQTGREFANIDALTVYIDEQISLMSDPWASKLASDRAVIEMVYAYKALDEWLKAGNSLPSLWQNASCYACLPRK